LGSLGIRMRTIRRGDFTKIDTKQKRYGNAELERKRMRKSLGGGSAKKLGEKGRGKLFPKSVMGQVSIEGHRRYKANDEFRGQHEGKGLDQQTKRYG